MHMQNSMHYATLMAYMCGITYTETFIVNFAIDNNVLADVIGRVPLIHLSD